MNVIINSKFIGIPLWPELFPRSYLKMYINLSNPIKYLFHKKEHSLDISINSLVIHRCKRVCVNYMYCYARNGKVFIILHQDANITYQTWTSLSYRGLIIIIISHCITALLQWRAAYQSLDNVFDIFLKTF